MKNKKLKWYGVLFALFILFLYIMGTYDLFMMLGHNEAYYISKGYGQIVHEYFTNYPIIGLVFWIINLLCGLLSPILYLLKNKYASKVALVSFWSDWILILLGALFNNRFKVFSTFVIGFDLFILLITLFFGLFVYYEDKKIKKRVDFMNKNKVDKGFELSYDNLSYRRKFIRTIWLTPIGIVVGILITYINLIVSIFYWIVFIIVMIIQLKHNYTMWKKESK